MDSSEFLARGEDVTIYGRAVVLEPGQIRIGNSVIIDDFVFLNGAGGVTIGDFVHIAGHAAIAGGGGLTLDDFAGLSGGVRVYTGNDDYTGQSLTNPTVPAQWRIATRMPVHVGKHAIVGANTVVLPGVTIGEGASVGALSLVTRDVEPWTINVGAPSRPIRDRPSARMLEMEAELRAELYDAAGRYIPRSGRTR